MEKLVSGSEKLGLSLTDRQLEKFEIYFRELTDWNRRMNLTTITGYEDVQVNHFLDSVTLIPAIREIHREGNPRIIDIGTGAGMPGIPVKIVLPEIRLSLLEATAKKAEFLRHIINKLELDKVEIITGRAEEVAHRKDYRETFDIALSRAVAHLAELVELSLPFCRMGSRFIAQKKGGIKQEIAESEKAITTLGGKIREVQNIGLEEFPDERCLIIVEKLAASPDKYPRRPGIPAKRPIS